MQLSLTQPDKVSNKPLTGSRDTLLQQALILLSGTFFGIVLVKSELASLFRIRQMFRLEDPHMFLVLMSATVVGALSLYLIKRFQLKAIHGAEIKVKTRKFHKGAVIGGQFQ